MLFCTLVTFLSGSFIFNNKASADVINNYSEIWDGSVAKSFETGDGSTEKPYVIKNASQLALLSKLINEDNKTYGKKNYKLDSNIYLNNTSDYKNWSKSYKELNIWTPIGNEKNAFGGIFQGNGFKIYGMYTIKSDNNLGLFGCTDKAMVKNVSLKECYINTYADSVGGIIGKAINTDVIKCSVNGLINGDENTGGIVGYYSNYIGGYNYFGSNPDRTFKDCTFDGYMFGNRYVGGIAGKCDLGSSMYILFSSLDIVNCKNKGRINGLNYSVGGIVGGASESFKHLTIYNCENIGEIKSTAYYVGGMIGFNESCDSSGIPSLNIEKCINKGFIYGNNEIGGIVGHDKYNWGAHSLISSSYNAGSVNGKNYVGGLVGCTFAGPGGGCEMKINNCYCKTSITGTDYVSGIAGTGQKISMTTSYYVGNIVCSGKNKGALSGDISNVIGSCTNCYYGDCDVDGNMGVRLNSNQLKDYNYFSGFDFDTVWNITESVNDNMPYLSLTEGTVSQVNVNIPDITLKKDQIAIYVVDVNGETIDNASVYLDDKKISDNGIIIFDRVGNKQHSLKVTATGYKNYIKDIDVTNKDRFFISVMEKGNENDFYISTATLSDEDGNKIDVRNYCCDITKYSDEKKNKRYTLDVKVNTNGNELDKVILYQIKSGKKIESNNGMFDSINIGKLLDNDGDKDICLYAIDKNGITTCLFNTLININGETFAIEPGDKKLSIGDGIKFTLPDKCPVFGGMEISLGFIEDLPFTCEIDDDSAKFVLGSEIKKDDDGKFDFKEYKSFVEKVKDSLEESKKSKKDYLSGLKGKKANFSSEFTPEIKEQGYIEFKKISGKWQILDANLMLAGKCEYGYEKPFFVGYVPCYYSVKGGFEVKWNGKIIHVNLNDEKDNMSAQLDGSIAIKLDGTLGLGVGIPKVLTLGVEGQAGLEWEHKFSNHHNKVELEGKASIEVTALGVNLISYDFLSGKVLIYETDNPNSLINGMNKSSLNDFDSKEFTEPENRNYIRRKTKWYGNTSSESDMKASGIDAASYTRLLRNNVYQNAKPQIYELDGKKVLFWLEDNRERYALNKTMLVYSLYDELNDVWSEPVAIYDDETADFDYSFDGEYIVWQNAGKVFSEGDSLEDICKNSEIVISKWDGNKFTKPVNITQNDIVDMLPSISTENDSVVVTWIENDDNNLWGSDGKSYLMESHLNDNVFSEPLRCAETNSCFTDISSTIKDGKVYVSYVIDEDGDYTTTDDWNVYVYNDGRNESITDNEVLSSNPQLVNYNDNVYLFWYEKCNIRYCNLINSEDIKMVFPSDENSLNDNFCVKNQNGEFYAIWNYNVNNHSEIATSFWNGEEWSKKSVVCKTDAEITQMTSLVNDNNNMLISYISSDFSANPDDSDTAKISDLSIMEMKKLADIEVSSVTCDYEDLQAGDCLKINALVRNKGLDDASDISIELRDDDGLVLSNKVLPLLNMGEEINMQLDYLVPENPVKSTLHVYAHVNNAEDLQDDNNSCDYVIGNSDMVVNTVKKVDLGEKSTVIAEIENIGYEAAHNVRVELRRDNPEGEVVAVNEYNICDTDAKILSGFNIDVDSELLVNGYKSLFVTVITETEEHSFGNNYKVAVLTPFKRNPEIKCNTNKLLFYEKSKQDSLNISVNDMDNYGVDADLFSFSRSSGIYDEITGITVEKIINDNERDEYVLTVNNEIQYEGVCYLCYNHKIVDLNSIVLEQKEVDYSELDNLLNLHEEKYYTSNSIYSSGYYNAVQVNTHHSALRQEEIDEILSQLELYLIKADGVVELISNEEGTFVDGEGRYAIGDNVSAFTFSHDDRFFEGWYSGTELVSKDNWYEFAFTKSCKLEAKFRDFYDTEVSAHINNNIYYDGSAIEEGTDFEVSMSNDSQYQLENLRYAYCVSGDEVWIDGLPTVPGKYNVKISAPKDYINGYNEASTTVSVTINNPGRIRLSNSFCWDKITDNITYDIFRVPGESFSIDSYLKDSDVYYYVDSEGSTEVITENDLISDDINWIKYTGLVTLTNNKNVIYAKIIDRNTGMKYYVCSDGINISNNKDYPTVSVLGATLRTEGNKDGTQSLRIAIQVNNASKACACGIKLKVKNSQKDYTVISTYDSEYQNLYMKDEEEDKVVYTVVIQNIPEQNTSTDFEVVGFADPLPTINAKQFITGISTKSVQSVLNAIRLKTTQ